MIPCKNYCRRQETIVVVNIAGGEELPPLLLPPPPPAGKCRAANRAEVIHSRHLHTHF